MNCPQVLNTHIILAETKAGVDLSSRYQREQELDAGKYKDVCGVLPEVSGIFQSAQSAFA